MYEWEKEIEKKQSEETKHGENDPEEKTTQEKIITLFGGLSTN